MRGYDVLVIDPPWPKKKGGRRKIRPNQGRSLDYKTMSISDIFALLDREIFPRASQPHTIFVWAIDQFLHDAEDEMKRRGYRLHARMIWDKQNGVAPCFSVRYSHEYLLWFYKPSMVPVAVEQRGKFCTVFQGKLREHSRKPDEAYAMITQMFPRSRRIDVFSRERRSGWDQWGDEVNKF